MTSPVTDPRSVSAEISRWACDLAPSADDVAIATRALVDTVGVAIAGRNHSSVRAAHNLPDAVRWAVAAHALDFDDLHLTSTTHISAICVPTAVATGGGIRAYLAAAGVMARLGAALGWTHYSAGWHSTCTAGAPAAAVGAGIALGLDASQLSTAMALAIPAAGGVQRAFGTDAKPLQVGFAVHAGIRAAQLALAGASADPTALGSWFRMVGGDPAAITFDGPAIPGGLATKLFPCCYALQRPLSALGQLGSRQIDPRRVTRIVVRTPRATVAPLIHHDPTTGLEAKFSLEYGVVAALLDEYPGFASFSDDGVRRPAVRHLIPLVKTELTDGGDQLLAGQFEAEVETDLGLLRATMQYPAGSPQQPATNAQLSAKLSDCLAGTSLEPHSIGWSTAQEILSRYC